MRRITSALLALTLLTGAGMTTSCKKQQDTPLEQFTAYDDQITGFSLLTEDPLLQAALARTAFTIRNSQTGLITNPQALPYSTSDYQIHLNIQAAARDALIDVITSDGQTIRWTSVQQTFSSSQLLGGFQLRVRHLTGGTGPELSSYTYQVSLKRYTSDPQTFSWSTAAATGLPAFSDILGVSSSPDGATQVYFRQSDGSQAVASFTEATGTWTTSPLSGLPAGEELTSVLSHQGTTYATSSAHRLYQFAAGSFSPIALPAGAAAPVSLLAGSGSQLYLIAQNGQGIQSFARYDITSRQLTDLGRRPQSNFPVTGAVSYQGTAQEYQGTYTYLAGGRTADGGVASALWATTNGTDWLVSSESAATNAEIRYQSIASSHQGQRLYRFASTATGLLFQLSRDGGRSWEAARDAALVGLTSSDFAGYPLFAFSSTDGQTIYLLRGARQAGESARLYAGHFGGLETTTD